MFRICAKFKLLRVRVMADRKFAGAWFVILLLVGVLGSSEAAFAVKMSPQEECATTITFFKKDVREQLVGDKRAAYCKCYEKYSPVVLDHWIRKKGIKDVTLDDWKDITRITMSVCLDEVKKYFHK